MPSPPGLGSNVFDASRPPDGNAAENHGENDVTRAGLGYLIGEPINVKLPNALVPRGAFSKTADLIGIIDKSIQVMDENSVTGMTKPVG